MKAHRGRGGFGVLLAHLVGVVLLDGRTPDLDAKQEGNALAWLSSTAAGSAAVAALLLAIVPPARRVLVLALAGGLAFLSLSEAAEIYEGLGHQVAEHLLSGSDEWARHIQQLTILPVLALVFVVVALLAPRARSAARTSLLASLSGLVLSSWSNWSLDLSRTGSKERGRLAERNQKWFE